LINKIDLLHVADFDIKKVRTDILILNKKVEIFPISAKTGDGLSAWCGWLEELIRHRR
jgi:hydrogenase nickel incorporation protein HypB